VEIDKRAIREKESIHVAFPFAIGGPTIRIGAGEYWFSPGKGQIPGANKDFFSVERWLDISNASAGVTLSCPQGALFEIGKPVDERRVNNGYKKWMAQAETSPTVFLYALNNYWHTNYKADQSGRIRYDFYLHFHGSFNAGAAERWGKEAGEPLISAWK
jgi:alpha-mannosidase